jgi:transcriptional regulator of arginine metabolism
VKAGRHRRIVQLIRQVPVTSQMQLVKLLRASGYPATQATVSRDLEDLGAIKVRRNGKVAYALASEAPAPAGEALKNMLAESVAAIELGGDILILKTPPGHASMVAGALDRGVIAGIAGTIAGDDTVLVVCKSKVMPRVIEKKLRSMIEAMPV